MSGISRVGVVGCGQMGAGFAEVCARAGLDVQVVASRQESIARGHRRLRNSLDRPLRKGRITEAERDAALDRVTFSTDLVDLAGCDLVLEAVAERLRDKMEIFAILDKVVEQPDAVLASNTSSIPIAKLGQAVGDAGRLVGLHFFNPVPVMPLVELITSLRTTEEAATRTRSFVTDTLGKQVVQSRDQPGFLVNALLVPYLLSAVRMLESGVASAEDIDRGMTLGCGHPMGPLALIDMIGLDIIAAVGEAMFEETKERLHAPPTLLLRMVENGHLGRKSGRGFHEYP